MSEAQMNAIVSEHFSEFVQIFSRSDLELQYVVHLLTHFHSAVFKSDGMHHKT
jgi:hypothetical protein